MSVYVEEFFLLFQLQRSVVDNYLPGFKSLGCYTPGTTVLNLLGTFALGG